MDATNQSTIVVFECERDSKEEEPKPTDSRKWITIVVETSGLTTALNTVLQFQNLSSEFKPDAFNVWRTCEGSYFKDIGPVTVGSAGATASVTMTFLPECIYTLVSATTMAPRGAPITPNHPIPPHAAFPTVWSDDFDNYADQAVVKYFTDEAGSFNAAKPPSTTEVGAAVTGMVFEQAVPMHPINGRWWGNSEPYTLLGDSQNWTDMTITCAVMVTPAAPNATLLPNATLMPAPSFARVCGRISTPHGYNHGHPPAGAVCSIVQCIVLSLYPPPAGYCLIVDSNNSWFLSNGGKSYGTRDMPYVLASGSLGEEAVVAGGRWHTLQLDLVGTKVTGTVDGKVVGQVNDRNATFTYGMVAIGSGWHVAYFDNFTVNAQTK
jgi:hypothetical protein